MLGGLSAPIQFDPALQQRPVKGLQEAARRSVSPETPGAQQLPENEQVALSKETLSNDKLVNGHSGLEALLAGLGEGLKPPAELKPENKVKEIGEATSALKSGGAERQPKRELEDLLKSSKSSNKPGEKNPGPGKLGEVNPQSKTSKPKDSLQPSEGQSVHGVQASPGSKGAPKTQAPRPVGQVEANLPSKPDQKPGRRLFSRPNPQPMTMERVNLSEESKQMLLAGHRPSGS